jgi:hypothetical protein
MTTDELEKLNALGFVWKPAAQWEGTWQQQYDRLGDYQRTQGHCRVPQNHPGLGLFVRVQRRLYQTGKLDPERRDKLEQLGFCWSIHTKRTNETKTKNHEGENTASTSTQNRQDKKWEIMFQRLLQFKEKHQHTLVPYLYDQDRKLGSWVMMNRQVYKEGRMPPERHARLQEIDFVFEVQVDREDASLQQRLWNAQYERLQAFRQTYQHSRVPKDYPADTALSNWVAAQRSLQRKGMLLEARREALDKIGFVWNPGARGTWTLEVPSSVSDNATNAQQKQSTPSTSIRQDAITDMDGGLVERAFAAQDVDEDVHAMSAEKEGEQEDRPEEETEVHAEEETEKDRIDAIQPLQSEPSGKESENMSVETASNHDQYVSNVTTNQDSNAEKVPFRVTDETPVATPKKRRKSNTRKRKESTRATSYPESSDSVEQLKQSLRPEKEADILITAENDRQKQRKRQKGTKKRTNNGNELSTSNITVDPAPYVSIPNDPYQVGKRVSVHWPNNKKVRNGEIVDRDEFERKVLVQFEERGSKWFSLRKYKVHLLGISDLFVGTLNVEELNSVKVGTRLSIWWSGEKRFYTGTVTKFDKASCKHFVEYDDGDAEWTMLNRRKARLVNGKASVTSLPGDSSVSKPEYRTGTRVSVWWPAEGQFYSGIVTKINEQDSRPHYIEYDDGDKEWTHLGRRKTRTITGGTAAGEQEALQDSDDGEYTF